MLFTSHELTLVGRLTRCLLSQHVCNACRWWNADLAEIQRRGLRGGDVADESLDAVVVSRALNMAALALVKAYSAPWVLPLFSEHLEFAGGPVSADWFHQKVADALEEIPEIAGDLPAAEHCRKWVSQEWLMRSRSRDDGRLQYQLSESSLRSLRIVRDLVTPGTSVSEARLGSITDAVRASGRHDQPRYQRAACPHRRAD